MLSERQRALLEAAIQDYIAAATPVSSEALRTHHRFAVSPATIRNDLAWLEEAGFLTHLFTSSGRVPTDRGYRFFVDELSAPTFSAADERALKRLAHQESFSPADLCEALAARTRTFVEFWDRRRGAPHASGLTEVLDQPEFADRPSIVAFVKLVDWLRDAAAEFLPRLTQRQTPRPEVFIGQELASVMARLGTAPRGVEEFSLVVISLKGYGRPPGVLLAIGPKRMVYPKVLGLFRWLKAGGQAGAGPVVIMIFNFGLWL